MNEYETRRFWQIKNQKETMRNRFISLISGKENNVMIGVILLVLVLIATSGCSKPKEIEPIKEPETCFNQVGLKDVLWKSRYSVTNTLYFNSNDTMYVYGNKAGKYKIECNRISIIGATKPEYQNFFIEVKYLINDTLMLSTTLASNKFYK
jgi:hypothetical protein